MIIFPAIDLKGGKCVRLKRGEMTSAIVFNDSPANQAKIFSDAGFQWLHCVDLDAAFEGRSINTHAMEEIRKLSHVLVGPAHEKTMGLIASVEGLISDVSILKDIIISFNYSTYDEDESEIGLKKVIYRIIQEQMSNILKHAGASEVKIELRKEKNDLILVITDNGKGFDTSAKGKGIGLKNIKNRAELYDGTVQIVCPPGKGCTMKIVFKGNIN